MFETKTYKKVLDDMLKTLPSGIDRREGSVAYDSMAPAAFEISRVYATLDVFLQLGFLTSATGEYLDLKAAENGVFRFPPTKAVLKIAVSGYEGEPVLKIGLRLYAEKNGLYYTVLERESEGLYKVECTETGTLGNVNGGRFIPTTAVSDFNHASYESTVKYGENGEGDDTLRTRCLQKMGQVAAEGNIAEYHRRAEEFGGIGRIKVNPREKDVEIYILSGDNLSPEASLVENFQDYLDPESEGLGMGAAPIGAKIMVKGPGVVELNANISVRLISGANIATVRGAMESKIHAMIKEVSFVSEEFSYFDLASRLIATEGVMGVVSISLNGGTESVALPSFAVPYLKSCNVVAAT